MEDVVLLVFILHGVHSVKAGAQRKAGHRSVYKNGVLVYTNHGVLTTNFITLTLNSLRFYDFSFFIPRGGGNHRTLFFPNTKTF